MEKKDKSQSMIIAFYVLGSAGLHNHYLHGAL